MSDKKESPAPSVQPALNDAPAPAIELKKGEKYRLRAVYGLIVNPFTEDRFDTDLSKRVVADDWTIVQFNAGKLAITED